MQQQIVDLTDSGPYLTIVTRVTEESRYPSVPKTIEGVLRLAEQIASRPNPPERVGIPYEYFALLVEWARRGVEETQRLSVKASEAKSAVSSVAEQVERVILGQAR